ncbi:MAG: TIGR03643 family protein [Bdellovibrionaceae bacterium]|nr:TIGR03643 family protein [Pseudobdellovibrionaceae bacterium]
MGLSRKLNDKIDSFTPDQMDRLIRMGWEDRSTFESIETQFGLTENEFVRLMRAQLPKSTFIRWRKRIHNQGQLKHETKRGFKTTRFKCSRQSVDGVTKGWK